MDHCGGRAWRAQLGQCLTLDFGSAYDLVVPGIKPCLICADSDYVELAWDSLPPSHCPSFAHAVSLSLSK